MRENTGKVVLVGAGPGDTGLLTLKGEKYIKQADCLVYDRLSSPQLLSMAKAGCELIYVGKENHKHVMKFKGRRSVCIWKRRRGSSLPGR